jgi:hypothetical protein
VEGPGRGGGVDRSYDITMGKWSVPWRSSRADQVRNGRRDDEAADKSMQEVVACGMLKCAGAPVFKTDWWLSRSKDSMRRPLRSKTSEP